MPDETPDVEEDPSVDEASEQEDEPTRRGFIKKFGIVAGGLALGAGVGKVMSGSAAAGPTPRPKSNKEITEALAAGNLRWAAGQPQHPNLTMDVRAAQAKKQTPFAAVLACADSRVGPELVYDQGIGDLFVVRIAGNIASPEAIASLAYAVEHLGVTYIVVQGHEGCGAVKATVDAVESKKVAEEFAALINPIAPAVQKVLASEHDSAKVMEKSVAENAKAMAKALPKQSHILREQIGEGKLEIHAAVFSITTGVVTVLD